MKVTYLNSPIGTIEIKGNENGVTSVLFTDEKIPSRIDIVESLPQSLQNARLQLSEYFNGSRKTFDLPLNPQGTTFQKKVWEQLQTIPFGKTTTYQYMANTLGDPKVIRAAASANGKNPISIVIPCHRVIGSDGSLTGYAGGLHRKKWLLEHESPVKQGELF